jgi:hypothetical protein
MKDLGIDERVLIEIIRTRTNEQLAVDEESLN